MLWDIVNHMRGSSEFDNSDVVMKLIVDSLSQPSSTTRLTSVIEDNARKERQVPGWPANSNRLIA